MSVNVLRFDFLARDQASRTFEHIGKESDGLQSKLGKFGKYAGTALLGATTAFGGLAIAGVSMGIKTAAAMEQAQVGFTTLLGSGQKAQVFLSNLKKFAAATPFDLPGLVDSSRLLIGVGLSAKDTMGVLQNFGDAAGAVGVSQEAFQRIMLATSQAISAGKFQAGDLNQITEAGIPIWKILSEAMGKPVSEIRKLSSEGKLLTSDVLPLLNKQMHKDYGGAMAKQSQTLNGMWSTFMDTLNQGLGNVIAPLIPALNKGLAGATNTLAAAFKAVPGITKNMIDAFRTAKNYIVNDVRPVFQNIFKGVKAKLPNIDISSVGKTFIKQASSWSGDIITGVKTGFKTGDWTSLGDTLGDGLSKALIAGATGASKLGVAVGKWIGGVDWFKVGADVGKQAFPFIIGFSTTLVTGLIDTAKAHPLDTALFIISLIPIGKFASAFGPLRAFIESLPMGKWFITLMDHTAAPVYDAVAGFAKGFVGRIGRGFIDEFPAAAKILDRGIGGLTDGVRLRFMYMADAGKGLVDSLATGIGRGIASVVRYTGLLIKQMLAPYAGIVRWLTKPGIELVTGLISGILERGAALDATVLRFIGKVRIPWNASVGWLRSAGRNVVGGLAGGISDRLGFLSSTISNAINRVRAPFAKAGGWLVSAGRNIVNGIGSGMVAAVSAAGSWAANVGGKIVSAVKGYFGIHSPSTRMMSIGHNLITSVFKAMVDHNPVPVMGKIFGGMPEALGALAEKGLVSLKNLPGKALNALEGLGGAIGGKLSGLLGLGGTKLGGGLSAAERWIIMHESGGRTSAQNPTSTAFGLGQLLIANRRHYASILGVSPNTTNYNDQLSMFRMYVRERYGNAQNAQAFWESHGWYDKGGIASGRGMFGKNTLEPERVLSGRQTVAFENLVQVLDRGNGMAQSSPAGGDIDYRKLGEHVAAAFQRAGIAVNLDGRAVGRVMGTRSNLTVRTT